MLRALLHFAGLEAFPGRVTPHHLVILLFFSGQRQRRRATLGNDHSLIAKPIIPCSEEPPNRTKLS